MPKDQDPLQNKLNELMAQASQGGEPDLDAFMDSFLEFNRQTHESSAFPRIMKEINARHPPSVDWSYETIVNDEGLPVGHRRMLAVYFSTADIDNGGFSQYFENGFGYLSVPAIEAYEKAGQAEIAKVMKRALKICLTLGPVSEEWTPDRLSEFRQAVAQTNLPVPQGFLDHVDTEEKSLDDLNDDFYELTNQLPSAPGMPTGYPDGFITWYYKRFPDDFVLKEPASD